MPLKRHVREPSQLTAVGISACLFEAVKRLDLSISWRSTARASSTKDLLSSKRRVIEINVSHTLHTRIVHVDYASVLPAIRVRRPDCELRLHFELPLQSFPYHHSARQQKKSQRSGFQSRSHSGTLNSQLALAYVHVDKSCTTSLAPTVLFRHLP